MRIFGLLVRRSRQPDAARSAGRPTSRPGWANPFGPVLAGYIPGRADLDLYRAIREGIPIVDAAIDKLVRLTGQARTTSPDGGEDQLSTRINGFLDSVRINGYQQGFAAYLNHLLGDLLTYGRAAGEIVLDGARQDVYALVNIDARTVRILPGETVFDSQLVQVGVGPYRSTPGASSFAQPLPPDLTLYAIRAQEGDDPHGVSLLRSLPFASQVLLRIHSSIGFAWERFGDPTYMVSYVPSKEFTDDGNLTKTNAIAGDLTAKWQRTMSAKHEGTYREDLVTVGDVRIRAIGADGNVLDAQVPNRVITEQIVARLGLPPFMLGLSWSTTERMSTQQAEALIAEIKDLRAAVEPVIAKVIDTWLVVRGMARAVGMYRVGWSDVTLQDAVQTAQARLLNARAQALEQAS
jgi:hypothetical protein